MKYTKIIHIFLINLFLCIASIKSEGFISNTLIKTPSGYSTVDALLLGDTIVSPSADIIPIARVNQCRYTSCIKITMEDICLHCAPDQKLYSYNYQQWICAQDLKSTDFLIDYQKNPVAIDTIEIIKQECLFYALSLDTNHTFCVSPLDIVAHNAAPIMVVMVIETIAEIAPIIKTGLTIGATLLRAHFAKKRAHKKFSSNAHNDVPSNNYSYNSPDPNDPNNNQNKEHPHGIYKDAPYHHKNSRRKSKCPNNGQHCLDYSLPTKTKQRIAIEGDSFVVLHYTRQGEYHGFKVDWNNLHDSLRRILIEHGFVKETGKIIKHITEKWPS